MKRKTKKLTFRSNFALEACRKGSVAGPMNKNSAKHKRLQSKQTEQNFRNLIFENDEENLLRYFEYED